MYRPFHVVLVVGVSGEGSFFVVFIFFLPLSPVCNVAILMVQLCTQVLRLRKYLAEVRWNMVVKGRHG